MIPPRLSFLVASTVNHLLAREPWARDKLMRHAGKIAAFDAGMVKLRIRIAADGMLEAGDAGDNAAVTIRAKMADLPLMLQNPAHAFSYVRIEGDADFANAISQVAQALRWDAEGDLSRFVGDIAAARLVGGAKAVTSAVRDTHRKLAENAADYLLDENPTLVRPALAAEFAADVIRLRDDVERLAKRIEKLEGGVK